MLITFQNLFLRIKSTTIIITFPYLQKDKEQYDNLSIPLTRIKKSRSRVCVCVCARANLHAQCQKRYFSSLEVRLKSTKVALFISSLKAQQKMTQPPGKGPNWQGHRTHGRAKLSKPQSPRDSRQKLSVTGFRGTALTGNATVPQTELSRESFTWQRYSPHKSFNWRATVPVRELYLAKPVPVREL